MLAPDGKVLRVLQVTARYLPLIGGVENHVYQVSRRLVQKGVDVTVLTANPAGRLPAGEIQTGVKIRRVRSWPAKGDLYFAPAIYFSIVNGSWDVVHVQSYHTLVAPMAMAAAWRARIPYVLTFHGGGHSSRLRNSIRRLQRRLLRPLLIHSERLVAVAEFEIPLYGQELNIPVEKFRLIPNGTDLPIHSKMEKTLAKKSLIVSIGRLERYKGHQRMVEALPEVLRAIPDACLWIIGSGPYESELMQLVQKYHLEDRVDIHAVSAADREKMAGELSQASLAVLFSDFETHPLSILEAVSLGVPALVTDTSGLKELAEKGLARSISLNSSPHEIAMAIIDQLQHPQWPSLFQLPTWDDCTEQLLDLYRNMVKTG